MKRSVKICICVSIMACNIAIIAAVATIVIISRVSQFLSFLLLFLFHLLNNFAGILSNQLLLHVRAGDNSSALRVALNTPTLSVARNNSPGALVTPGTVTAGVDVQNDIFGEGSDDVVVVEGQGQSLCLQTSDGSVVEVVDRVYDVNGQVHEAVRIDCGGGSSTGTIPRRCSNRNCRFDGSQCPASKTQVKCLQCDLPLCYPLRNTSKVDRNQYCFAMHIHTIQCSSIRKGVTRFVRTTGV